MFLALGIEIEHAGPAGHANILVGYQPRWFKHQQAVLQQIRQKDLMAARLTEFFGNCGI